MAHTKAKVRKSKGVVALTPYSKGAGSKRLVTPLTVNLSIHEEVPVSIHDYFSQKLDVLMKVVTDLSTRGAANEDARGKERLPPLPILPPLFPDRGSGTREHPHPPDISEEVHRSMAERMWQVTAYTSATNEGHTSHDEELLDGGSIRSPAFTGQGPPQSSTR